MSSADLGTAEGCGRAVSETERRLGPIDLLVVNHGIGSAHERLVWEQDPEVWRETMRINLDGPFELARLTVGGMCKRGFGRLVFTSSTAGEKAERCGSAYTASKHGVIGLARAVAQDAGPFGVTSNAVLPGWVRTAMAERSARTEAGRRGITVEQVWEERAAIYPQKRVLEPREIAQVIAFLCSEAAGGVNGEAVTVALGGMWWDEMPRARQPRCYACVEMLDESSRNALPRATLLGGLLGVRDACAAPGGAGQYSQCLQLGGLHRSRHSRQFRARDRDRGSLQHLRIERDKRNQAADGTQ